MAEPSAKRARTEGGSAEAASYDRVLINCRVATMSRSVEGEYGALRAGAADSCVAISGESIAYLGGPLPAATLAAIEPSRVHDLGGKWVTPGLVDCHTHTVYGGNRSGEWELKLKGATYEEGE